MMFIGVAWSLSNMVNNVSTAQNEVDDALTQCLEDAGYVACREASMNGCLPHRSLVECKQQWMDAYERVT